VRLLSLLVALTMTAACAPLPATVSTPSTTSFALDAEFIIAASAADPSRGATRFGGISGIVALQDGRELLAVSDERENSRVYRLRISGAAPAMKVERVGVIALEAAPGAPAKLDPEAIALTGDGHILISSEGVGSEEPRLPPALIEYSPEGRFIRQLTVHPRFAPTPRGPLTSGVRGNAGFESLTTTPDFERLFTGTERPLVQDGDDDAFAGGARCRILEYVRRDGGYEPARELAYELDPLEQPSFEPRFAANGLVELLAISSTELLAMERGYTEAAGRAASMSRIRIFRITLEGATDVSAHATLRGAAGVVAVRKTLLLDLSTLPGLSASLRNLDNFEGLAWGSRLPDGRRNLIVVSDDNFNEHQVTAFLFLRPEIE
jgi:hypothetical protein